MAEQEEDPDVRTDVEVPEINPDENVYSYLMFASLWRQGTDTQSYDVHMAYILAFLCLFMQGVILAAIWNSVVSQNIQWRTSVMNTGNPWDIFQPKPVNGCNPGGSLCFVEDGEFTCAPPTVQLTSRWDDLDIDGDGIWTYEEAKKMKKEIKCDLRVNTLEVFRVFIKFLKKRSHIIWLHPDTLAGKAIHEPYFKYAAGDIIMCGYRNSDMCPNLLKRGFFDAPLKHNTVPRVGNTTDSALDYCMDLLGGGGFCERTLPSTYSVWKTESVAECKKPLYDPFTFEHPITGEEKSLLTVDYEARRDYEMVQTPFFITYKFLLVTLWILAMVYEGRGILLIFNWVYTHPHSKDGTDAVQEYEDGDDVKYTITAVQQGQRYMIGFLTFARLVMLMVLSVVGTTLLLRSTSYMTLIMDGVALVFVLDIASILYAQAIRPKSREEIQNYVDPMEVRLLAPDFLKKQPALQDLLWLLLVFGIVAAVMWWYYETTVTHLADALKCTCGVKGEHCREADLFDYDFWYEYWHKTTPRIFRDVARLKSGGESSPSPAPSSEKGGEDHVELHQHHHHHHQAMTMLHRGGTAILQHTVGAIKAGM